MGERARRFWRVTATPVNLPLEDPVVTSEEMVKLRKHCSIPFSSHNTDLARAMAPRIPDAIRGNLRLHRSSGSVRRRLRTDPDRFLVIQWRFRNWQRGLAASLHRPRMDPRIQWAPLSEAGDAIPIPEGPGLGVMTNREKLDRCHRDFVELGPMNKYHDGGSRRILPPSATVMIEDRAEESTDRIEG